MSTDTGVAPVPVPAEADTVEAGATEAAATECPADRSMADVLARRLLRIENAAPRALMPMRGSLMLSAVRCLLSYVFIPLALPLAGWLAPIAAPLSLVLTLAAMVMAVVSLRRVWLADWSKRWAYTVFAGIVLVVLTGLVVLDVRAILS